MSIHVEDAADVVQKMKVMFYKIDVVCAHACIIRVRFNPEPLWRKLPPNIRNQHAITYGTFKNTIYTCPLSVSEPA